MSKGCSVCYRLDQRNVENLPGKALCDRGEHNTTVL